MTTYKRQYLPGYTGFVPLKKEIFGCTQGDVNRITTGQMTNPAVQNLDPETAQKMTRSLYTSPQRINKETEALLLSNQSKFAPNWIGGPTSDTRQQHVPGYMGYVPGIKAENQIGRSFAKTSADSINQQFSHGHDVSNQERFTSTQQAQFNKNSFRRLAKEIVDPAQMRDTRAIQEFNDYDFQGITPQKKNIYMEMPTVGYMGKQSPYRRTSPEIYHRKSPEFNYNALAAKIKYTDVVENEQYDTLPEGFKSAAISRRSPFTSPFNGGKAVNIPVVGYQGHRKGVKAQGMYGKSYKDCAIQSEILKQIT